MAAHSSKLLPVSLFVASLYATELLRRLRGLKQRAKMPFILYHDDPGQSAIVNACKDVLLEYKSSTLLNLLDYYGELQMIYTLYTRKFFPISIQYERELLVLQDGGTVGIDWLVHSAKEDILKPIVILQHGLCGHSYSHYMKGIPRELVKRGFYVVSFVARGCGGLELTTPETFTAARTSDFRAVVERISLLYPARKISAVGYSLGAGLLLKYLGECGEACPLHSAVAVSPSFDFHVRSEKFAHYEKLGMLQGLVDLVQKHKSFLQNHPQSCLDWNGMLNAKTIREFDQAAIVGKPPNRSSHRFAMESSGSPDKMTGRAQERDFLHFATVDDYYTASSAKHYAHLIRTPTLTINAEDDHISSAKSVPTSLDQIGLGLAVLRTANGSHVSFSDACWPWEKKKEFGANSVWSDRAATAWLAASHGFAL